MQTPRSSTSIIAAVGSRRWLRMGVALLVAVWLTGCSSVHFGYNQGPRLVYWWLDGYVDFNDAQAPRVKAAIASWFAWHRRTQLTDYADLLARAQGEVAASVEASQACHWFNDMSLRADAAFEQALPGFVLLVQLLEPKQIDNIRRRSERNDETFRKDYLQPDPGDRQRANLKRVVERSETLYGSFDQAQRQQIAAALTTSPFDPERWFAERRERQADLQQTLSRLVTSHASAAEIETALRGLKARTEHSPRPAYRTYEDALVQANCSLAAQIQDLATPAQRNNAAKTLRNWEGDLRKLATETPD